MLDIEASQLRIRTFKQDFTSLSTEQLVMKYLILGEPFAIKPSLFDQLRIDVARHFNVHPNNVVMVGSGKLGFSIAPKKRYKPFDYESDIDLAIVSKEIYEDIWREVFKYDNNVRGWTDRDKFGAYHLKGWIRPDKLPTSSTFNRTQEWWDFFRELTSSGKYGSYKIRAGLFHSFHFLETYQAYCVTLCQNEI